MQGYITGISSNDTSDTGDAGKISFIFYLRISQLYRFVQSTSLSELIEAKFVIPALNSKLNYGKLAAAVRVFPNTQNLFISRGCLAEDS